MNFRMINIIVEFIGGGFSFLGLFLIRCLNMRKNYRFLITMLFLWCGLILISDGLAGIYAGVPSIVLYISLFTTFFSELMLFGWFNEFYCLMVYEQLPLSEFRTDYSMIGKTAWPELFQPTKQILSHGNKRIKRLVHWRNGYWFFIGVLVFKLVVNLFSGDFYFVDTEGVYHRGVTFFYTGITIACITFLEGLFIIGYRRFLNRYVKLMAFIYIVGSISMMILSSFIYGPGFLFYGYAFMIILMIISIVQRIIRDSEEQARELEISKRNLLLSQMKPHFIYNCLNTIYGLCDIDTERAKEAIEAFSDYLRANMDSFTSKERIPFSEEMNHVRNYLQLEQIRFGNRVHVEYDLQCEDFEIPPLTVQPLVENAVKHGICVKKSGGTVRICTSETKDQYQIRIVDDGAGFDLEKINWDDEGHIGLSNVRNKLKLLCNGQMEIISSPGAGTEVIIYLKKSNGKELPV